MAIFKSSAVVSDLRNSIGGSTFTRSIAGGVIRARVRPTHTATHLQNYARTNHTIKIRHWRVVLTDANRLAWNTKALTVRWTNALGEDYSPTGFALFMRQASGIPYYRFTLPTLPGSPLKTPPPPVYLFWNEINDHIYILTFPNQPAPANGWLSIWHSQTLPPTWYHHGGPSIWAGIRTFATGVHVSHPLLSADPTFRPARVWVRLQASLTRYTQSVPITLSISIPPAP